MTKSCDFAHVLGYAAPAAKPVAVADAELLRLGAEFERSWAAEDDLSLRLLGDQSDAASDANEAAINATSAIVEKIVALQATTLPGLIMKARAFAWCSSGDDVVTAEEMFGPNATTDVRIMLGIVDDLRRIEVPSGSLPGLEVMPHEWEGGT